MRQRRKLIDVSTMDPYIPRPSSSRPDSGSRRSSKRPSVSSGVTSRRSQSLTLPSDLRPNTANPGSVVSTAYGSLFNPPNDSRSLDLTLPSNAGSRVTSSVGRRTASSMSTLMSRSPSKMTGTASSLRTTASTVCSKGSESFPDSIGMLPGLTVWVLESRRLVQTSRNNHGFFHQGNGYLILKVNTDESKYIHVWLGTKSDPADVNVLQTHAENLDRHIEGANFLSIENETYETDAFLDHFQDGVIIVEGKSKTSMRSASSYTKRLYIVRGRRFPVATCTSCSLSSLASDRALILDGFPRIYVWLGPDVDNVIRVKAIQLAHKIRDCQRKGVSHIIVIDKKDTNLHEAFIRKLHSEGEEEEEGYLASDEDNEGILQLYRINGDRPLYDMPYVAEKPLKQKYLTSKDCFLLTRGPRQAVFIWIGANADVNSLYSGLRRAQNFTHHYNYPMKTPVCRVTEGDEPACFKACFSDWSDRSTSRQRQLVRTYNVANIGRALFSRSDCRTIAQMSEVWSDDEFLNGDGATEVWRISNDSLQARVWDQPGIFNNRYSYVILYQETTGKGDNKNVVYYWLGCKSSKESHKAAFEMVNALDSALRHKVSIVRVLDGKEPKHFFTIFQYSMLVYDGDLDAYDSDDLDTVFSSSKGESLSLDTGTLDSLDIRCPAQRRLHLEKETDIVNAFVVRECLPGCMRVLQVPPLSSSLNTSAAYIVYNETGAFVWYGKNASANEREYSKSMLDNLRPDRLHQYEIVNEGREPDSFWEAIIRDGAYLAEFPKQVLSRRPSRLHLYIGKSCTFWNVEQFSQEDLNETDVYILDTFDQLLLWRGKEFESDSCEIFLSIFQAYLKADPAGRSCNDTQLWLVSQGFEPDIFTKHFPDWFEFGFGGVIAYEAARKWARQENAAIDIDCQMVDRTYTCSFKLSYKELVTNTHLDDENIDYHHKEHHLTDKEFNRVLRMTRAQFYRLPEWKQTQILRSSKLRRTSFDDPPASWSVDSATSHISYMDFSSAMRKKTLPTPTPLKPDR